MNDLSGPVIGGAIAVVVAAVPIVQIALWAVEVFRG